VIIDMSLMRELSVDSDARRVRAGAGLLVAELQQALAERGLYYPPAPTHEGATIGGNVATNAAGAATFKYGSTRDWVERIEVVLRDGRHLALSRGEVSLPPGERLQLSSGDTLPAIEIEGPDYRDPALRKLSAGYCRREGSDLIDLFIGSEGTLGFITAIELRVIAKPAVLMGLIFPAAGQMVPIAAALRDAAKRFRGEQQGPKSLLDVRSIEMFDQNCLALLAEQDTLAKCGLDAPQDAAGCLLFEQELPQDDVERESAEDELYQLLCDLGLEERCNIAPPDRPERQQALKDAREAVPLCINERRATMQRTQAQTAKVAEGSLTPPAILKAGGDMIVPFAKISSMIDAYYEQLGKEGLDAYVFGHISDGNLHVNALPENLEQVEAAERALFSLGELSIRLGGAPLSEHGVGRSRVKQKMLASFRGDRAIEQMKRIRLAFDPRQTMARGVLWRAD
jgi:D-lactate dehydrogenase (cytochrome)